MELIRGSVNIRRRHHGCVATIGNFDGVHKGHRAVIDLLAKKSAEYGLPSTVIVFEPQPQEYFAGDKAPARLTRLREKLAELDRCGVDRVLVLRFDAAFRTLPAREFIGHILVQGLGVKFIAVGDDFRFGKNRQGDFALMQQAGESYGFEVANMPTVELGGERVSSTRIRAALSVGDMELAELLLGRSYAMNGRVAHGDKRGRTIGFPTANIHLQRKVSPISGVFAVRMRGLPQGDQVGVANVGKRPTVEGVKSLLEVHLFGFNQEIYGEHVCVDFLHRLRDEKRFESFEALKEQIRKDAVAARSYFGITAQ